MAAGGALAPAIDEASIAAALDTAACPTRTS
jgi:hypothetical protein